MPIGLNPIGRAVVGRFWLYLTEATIIPLIFRVCPRASHFTPQTATHNVPQVQLKHDPPTYWKGSMRHQNQEWVFLINLSWLKSSYNGFFIAWLLQIFKGRFLKMRFYSYLGRFISTSVAPTYTNFSSFIHNYILQIFTEGFVDLSFIAWFT